jgi:undecaprenyl diphosphate synthase
MDGNGRWAKEKGEDRIFGHQNGVRSVRNCAEACAELGINHLTLYAFSTENWNRPKHEVNALMQLLVKTISSEIKTLNDNNISLHAIGNLEQLPNDCYTELQDAIFDTSKNTGLQLILALSYSGRWDILNAVKKIMAIKSSTAPEYIDDLFFKSQLATAAYPDPELLIRTSGEHRISNFLLWELAYTELYFCDIMWPDFEKDDLYTAILDYQQRERRFGKTSEQI